MRPGPGAQARFEPPVSEALPADEREKEPSRSSKRDQPVNEKAAGLERDRARRPWLRWLLFAFGAFAVVSAAWIIFHKKPIDHL
jgi:hypothetical protein